MGKATGTWKSNLFLSFGFLFSFIIGHVSSERILFLLPLSTNSHKIFFEPLINALAAKGHDVTVLTNSMTHPPAVNSTVKELVAVENEEFMKGYPEPFQTMKNGSSKMAFPFNFILEGCHKVIQSQAFRGVLRQTGDFDLILVDSFLSGCLDGFLYKKGAPFILVTTMPAPSYISERVGNFLPSSIVPVLSFRGYEEPNGEMGFWLRMGNFMHFLLARMYVNLIILPSLEQVYRNYLGEDVPGILEIESKASMIFMNSHFTMNFPRPLLPAVVEIGGIHCGKTTSPRKNSALEKFISKSASPHGFIYFSVGSINDLNNAPPEFIHTLLSTFAKLPQRVIIKWKTKEKGIASYLTGKELQIPKNVWVDDWFSQQDILGHENIRLFISHGGLLSMQEAVYHGVPVLGIPIGLDQDTNLHNAALQGYALKLDTNNLSEETLGSSINELLSNPRYLSNVRQLSKLFRHRLVTPLDTALFWTEYVLSTHKDNTTHYMDSPAKRMSIFQYYSCDILAFLMVALAVLLIISIFLIRRGIRVVCRLVMYARAASGSVRNFHKKMD